MKKRESLCTTVTLDGVVRRRAAGFCRQRGVSLHEGISELVRIGLKAAEEGASEKAFVIRPRSTGLRADLSYCNIEELIEFGEGPDHR